MEFIKSHQENVGKVRVDELLNGSMHIGGCCLWSMLGEEEGKQTTTLVHTSQHNPPKCEHKMFELKLH
jgi:hypothetical protein